MSTIPLSTAYKVLFAVVKGEYHWPIKTFAQNLAKDARDNKWAIPSYSDSALQKYMKPSSAGSGRNIGAERRAHLHDFLSRYLAAAQTKGLVEKYREYLDAVAPIPEKKNACEQSIVDSLRSTVHQQIPKTDYVSIGCMEHPPLLSWKHRNIPIIGRAHPRDLVSADDAPQYFDGPLFWIIRDACKALNLEARYGGISISAYGEKPPEDMQMSDITPGLYNLPERSHKLLYSKPIYSIKLQGICRKKKRFVEKNIADYKILVQAGEAAHLYLLAEYPDFPRNNLTAVAFTKTSEVLRQMDDENEEYDLALADEVSCDTFLRDKDRRRDFCLAFKEARKVYDIVVAVRRDRSEKVNMRSLDDALMMVRNESEFRRNEKVAMKDIAKFVECRGLKSEHR